MSFIKKIFTKKKSQHVHDFTQIMQKKEHCFAFLPDDFYQDFEIVSYLVNWNELFSNITVFTSDYNHVFCSKLINTGKISFRIFKPGQPLFNESVILNFSDSKEIQKYVARNQNSTIADINNLSNIQFLPLPKNANELITKFAQFYNLPLQKNELNIELTQAEKEILNNRFIQNRFHNFVFDCDKKLSAKVMESYVKTIKQNFSANVYLTDKVFNSLEMINIKEMPIHNLYELFCIASVCDLYITNKPELARLFGELGIFVLFLGEEINMKNVRCAQTKELFIVKNIIQKHLKEKESNQTSD